MTTEEARTMARGDREGAIPGAWNPPQWIFRDAHVWTKEQIGQVEALFTHYLPHSWSRYTYYELYKSGEHFRCAISTHEYGRPPALSPDFATFLSQLEAELQKKFGETEGAVNSR